jgi:O-antigen/teichoic acid export membrane protein
MTVDFWFNTRPAGLIGSSAWVLSAFLVLLLAMAIFFNIIKNRKRNFYNKIWNRLALFSTTNFIVGMFLLFFTYETIPFLSMRFWFLLWGLGMLVWLIFIFKVLKEIPKIKEEMAKEAEYKKYIP